MTLPAFPMQIVESDITLKWPCRTGDFFVWLRIADLHRSLQIEPRILDLWQMRPGDSVTITTRPDDLPSWFELHHTEVADALAEQMMNLWNNGRTLPATPLEAPNLWRVLAGDHVIWVGDSRPGISAVDGVLQIVSFTECALVYAEPLTLNVPDAMRAPSASKASDAAALNIHGAIRHLVAKGVPRTISTEWCLRERFSLQPPHSHRSR